MSEQVERWHLGRDGLQPSHYSSPPYTLFHTSASPARRTVSVFLTYSASYVYEHFGGNGKCREFAQVPRHKARATESKSNLRCSRCIENSFRLRRSAPNDLAVKASGRDDV